MWTLHHSTSSWDICYYQGQWEEATSLFEAAEHIFTDENPLAPHATASQLKLGCIDMRQGNYQKAMYVTYSLHYFPLACSVLLYSVMLCSGSSSILFPSFLSSPLSSLSYLHLQNWI